MVRQENSRLNSSDNVSIENHLLFVRSIILHPSDGKYISATAPLVFWNLKIDIDNYCFVFLNCSWCIIFNVKTFGWLFRKKNQVISYFMTCLPRSFMAPWYSFIFIRNSWIVIHDHSWLMESITRSLEASRHAVPWLMDGPWMLQEWLSMSCRPSIFTGKLYKLEILALATNWN